MLDLNISLSVSLSDPLLIKHFDHYNSNRPLHRSAETLNIISTTIAAEPEAPAILTNPSFNHGLRKMLNIDSTSNNHNHSSDRSDCSEIEETIDLLQLSNSCLNVASADIITSKKSTQRNIDSSSSSSPIERSNISSSHGDAPDPAPHVSTSTTNTTTIHNHSNAVAAMSKLEVISAEMQPSFHRLDHHHDLHGSVINTSSSSPNSAERSYNFQRRISRMQLDHTRSFTSKKMDSSEIMDIEAASIRHDQAHHHNHNKKQMFEAMDMAGTAEVICKEEDAEGEEDDGDDDEEEEDVDEDSKHQGRTRQLFPLKPTGNGNGAAGDIDDGDNKISDMVVEVEDEDREAHNILMMKKPPSPNGISSVNSLCRSNVHLSNPSSSSSSSVTNVNTTANNAAAMASVEANSAGLLSKCSINGSSFSAAPPSSSMNNTNSSTIRPPPWFANSPLLPLPPASSSLSQAFMAAAAAASINTSSSSSSCTSSSSSVQYSVVQNNMPFPSLMIHHHNHSINKQNHLNPNQDNNHEHQNRQNYQNQNQNQNHHEYVNAIANGTVVQVQQRSKKSRRGPRSRSSQYRGVTFYRRTGRWESHIWDTGKQVYLGGFDTAHAAARAYDRAAIKFRGLDADINFHINDYEDEIKHMSNVTKEEFVHLLRRQSMGFPRGSARFRGMALHKYGKWDARMGPLFGRQDEAAITNVAIPLAAPLPGREPMGPDEFKQEQNLELSLSMPARRHQQAGESRPILQSSLKLSNFPAEQEAVWRHNNQANFTGKFSGQLTSTTEMTQEQLQQVLLMQSRSASISRMHQVIDPSPLSNGMWAWQVQQLIAPSAAASSGFSPQQQIQQFHHHHHHHHHQQQLQQNHHNQQQQCQEITKPPSISTENRVHKYLP